MLDDSEYIVDLIRKYITGNILDKEIENLNVWRNSSDNNERLFLYLTNSNFVDDAVLHHIKLDEYEQYEWEKIKRRTIFYTKKRKWRLYINYAAVIILSMLVYVSDKYIREANFSLDVIMSQNKSNNNAYLTLANGEQIELRHYSKGTEKLRDTIMLNNSSNIYLEKNMISYDRNNSKEQSKLNLLTIPFGANYEIILSDGTVVFLNSGSCLKFPNVFGRDKRSVELSGEAYFKVAKDTNKPFMIKLGDINVNVIGTSFCIKAYHDDEEIKTTLLDGVVNIEHNGKIVRLKPGTQGRYVRSEKVVHVNTVNVALYTAWMAGYIAYDNQKLEYIMKDISRRYNLNIVFKNEKLKNIPFTIDMKNKVDIYDFFRLLEETERVKFMIEGSKIIIN